MLQDEVKLNREKCNMEKKMNKTEKELIELMELTFRLENEVNKLVLAL